jgi:hypothetical protein
LFVILCVGSGLATGKYYGTEEESRAQERAVEPLIKIKVKYLVIQNLYNSFGLTL